MYLVKNNGDFVNYYINKKIDWSLLTFNRLYLGGDAIDYAISHESESVRFKLLGYVRKMFDGDKSAIQTIESLAQYGMEFAYLFIADLYDRDTPEWTNYLNKAAKAGVLSAIVENALAKLEKGDESQIKVLDECGRKGESKAYYILSKYYYESEDYENAGKYLILAADGYYLDAISTAAQFYSYDNEIFDADHQKSLSYAKLAYELNDDESGILYARLLYSSDDIETDFEKAERVLLDLSDAGNAEAKFWLLDLWANAGVDEEESGDAYFKTAKEAVEGGFANANIFLGICYSNGIGCEMDEEKAIEAFNNGIEYLESLEDDVEDRVNAYKTQIAIIYKRHNLCQHCGGEFGGIVSKTCKSCGRKKDY